MVCNACPPGPRLGWGWDSEMKTCSLGLIMPSSPREDTDKWEKCYLQVISVRSIKAGEEARLEMGQPRAQTTRTTRVNMTSLGTVLADTGL